MPLNNTNVDVSQMIAQVIEDNLHEHVTTLIVERMVEEFRAEAEKVVREQVEMVTLSHVEQILDLANMSERLNINLNWENK